MFDFFSMAGNYNQRKVDNTVINGAVIDTCEVYDSEQPYETGIQHECYNNGEWIIVEQYNTKEESQEGHNRWVKLFESELPKELKDIITSNISTFIKALGGNVNETYTKTKKEESNVNLRKS